jgi:glycosyltransferase involved in cell wall biosynthesis
MSEFTGDNAKQKDLRLQPMISVVIPVFNEAAMVADSAREYLQAVRERGFDVELILAENGSSDQTAAIVDQLASDNREIRALHLPEPNYGGAMRAGIVAATAAYVICEEIDLCDVDFLVRALQLLQSPSKVPLDFVVGSKAMSGANDQRPLFRRLATRVYNRCLRVALGFRGTDTHGLKAMRRVAVLPYVAACVVEHDVFASELVIRCQRGGLQTREIPIDLREKRQPSIHLWRRVPRVLRQVWRLFWAIRFGVRV